MSNSVRPHRQQPTRFPCPWDSPGKNTKWVTISFSNPPTETASNKLQENLPLRGQRSLPTNAEVKGVARTVSNSFYTSLVNNKFDVRLWYSLAEMTTFQWVKLSAAALGLCLFVICFLLPCPGALPTREGTPSPFLYFIWVGVLSHFSLVCLCDSMDCSPPASSVFGILQGTVLEWVVMPSSRGSSWSWDRTHISYISCTGRWVIYHEFHLYRGWQRPHEVLSTKLFYPEIPLLVLWVIHLPLLVL